MVYHQIRTKLNEDQQGEHEVEHDNNPQCIHSLGPIEQIVVQNCHIGGQWQCQRPKVSLYTIGTLNGGINHLEGGLAAGTTDKNFSGQAAVFDNEVTSTGVSHGISLSKCL